MKGKVLVAGLLAAGLLVGCATYGKEISQAQVEAIVVGETTETELLTSFGKPLTRTVNSDGTSILSWGYARVGFAGSSYENRALSVIIGPDGRVQSHSMSDIDSVQ